MQCLLKDLKRLLDAACVQQPVAQAVEAASAQRGVSQFLGQCKRPAEPDLCPFVIVPGPQEAERKHALPFHLASMNRTSRVERSLIFAACALEVAQRFMGLPPRQVELCRWRPREMMCGFYGACQVVDGGLLSKERQRLFSRLLLISQRSLPHTCFIAMIGQVFQIPFARKGRDRKALQGFGNAAMQRLPLSQQKRGRDGLLRECVAKSKPIRVFLNHQLGRDHLFEESQQMRFITAHDLLEQGGVEAPPSHSSQCDETPGLRTQVRDSLLHGLLDAARNGSLTCSKLPDAIDKREISHRHERLEEFFDEKGIAFGTRIERVEEISLDLLCRRQHGTQHSRNIRAGKPVERALVGQSFPIQRSQPAPQAWMLRRLLHHKMCYSREELPLLILGIDRRECGNSCQIGEKQRQFGQEM